MKRPKELILPAYLLLCLLIGGSGQGVWGNALLQILALGILGWSIVAPEAGITSAARRLLWIIAATVALALAQLIPLPPKLWTSIPGRDFAVAGYDMLGMPLPWQAISLSPYDTVSTALTLLPPLALLVGMLRLRAWTVSGMFAAVMFGTAISILFGILQVSGGADGSWYFYRRTNLGVAVGTFANGNHFATLLLACLPILAGLVITRWRSAPKQADRSLTAALGVAAAAILAIGILINGSSAMLLLGPPVAIGTVMLALRLPPRRIWLGFAAIGLVLVASAATVVVAGKNLPGWGTSASVETRSQFWSTSLVAVADHGWSGTGLGTFEQVYRRYEDPANVDRWYLNHAHNDYLELAVEGGLPALMLLLAFLLWWIGRSAEAWRSPSAIQQKAAVIASAAILLHSVFDFPLRTSAISAVFALSLALLAGARDAVRDGALEKSERARHATL